jgi:Pyridoxamine 5'-phosphate oxidase
LQRNRRVSLLVVDPDHTGRYLQIRGDAELLERGALEQLNRLTRKYTSHPAYYGYVNPFDQASRETRIIVRIRAHAITCDAIHH